MHLVVDAKEDFGEAQGYHWGSTSPEIEKLPEN
jgi:hypothetical protein